MRTQQETRAKSIHTTNRAEAAVMAPQQIEIDTIGGQQRGGRILRVSGAITHLPTS